MKDLAGVGIRVRSGCLELLDQQLLPQHEVWLDIKSPKDMAAAILALQVRGAPLIGVAAALSLAQFAGQGCDAEEFLQQARMIRRARPTAVNLAWAIDRLTALSDPWEPARIVAEAEAIFAEDVALCDDIGRHGAALFSPGDRVLTHCNAGALATAGIGSAIGVIDMAHRAGAIGEVLVDETRPLLQGARLTAWELGRLGIPHRIICDSAAAQAMQLGQVDKIVVGADRIARNGDVANKVGTYSLAVNAAYHRIPLYVAAPYSTVDLDMPTGLDIPIELREASEVLGAAGGFGEVNWAPQDALADNPAFDVTPCHLISGWILDCGVFNDPSDIAPAVAARG